MVSVDYNLYVAILDEFQIKYFAERLKKIAKEQFGGVGKLADSIKIKNLSNYTKEKDPLEPRATFLYRLAKRGVDIHYLLTGEKFKDAEMLKTFEERFNKLEERITQLEAENYRYIKKIEALESANEELTQDKARLSLDLSRLLQNQGKKLKG